MSTLMDTFFQLYLFLRRGLQSSFSYRTALVMGVFSAALTLVQFGLLGRFVSEGNSFPLIEEYGGNLITYLIIGSTFTSFVSVALNSFQGAIRSEQQMGTLEHLLIANVSLTRITAFSAFYNFLSALMNAAILLAVTSWLFGVELSIDLAPTIAIIFLTILAMSGIGLTSAAIILVTKQGDPVGWVVTTLMVFFSGVLFPVEMLPPTLRQVSQLLPTTYALRALRLTMARNAGWSDIQSELLVLVLTTAITIPIGIWSFSKGLDRARRCGSLGEY